MLSTKNSCSSTTEEDTTFVEIRNISGIVESDKKFSIDVAATCLDVFSLASENLENIGLPLSCKLADNSCRKLKGCHDDNVHEFNARWNNTV